MNFTQWLKPWCMASRIHVYCAIFTLYTELTRVCVYPKNISNYTLIYITIVNEISAAFVRHYKYQFSFHCVVLENIHPSLGKGPLPLLKYHLSQMHFSQFLGLKKTLPPGNSNPLCRGSILVDHNCTLKFIPLFEEIKIYF